MAALDFPNSPTLNQQYAAPNGVTYQWDGAAWVVTGGPPGQLWTGGTGTLTPTDTTKRVVVPGPTATGADQSQLVLGTQTAKGRVIAWPASDWMGFGWNANYNGSAWAKDDTTKAAWLVNIASDVFYVTRAASGAGFSTTNLLVLDNGGNLTTVGNHTAATVLASQIFRSTPPVASPVTQYTGLAQLQAYGCYVAGSSYQGGMLNFYAAENWTVTARGTTAQITTTPTGTASATSQFTFDSQGNLTITGPTGTKSTGTTWANPCDRRIKEEIADYTTGLAAVLALLPRTFVYNGKGGSTAGLRGYGYIADEVAPVMPEMVNTTTGKLNADDEAETEIQTVDSSNVALALVNAIKELAAQVHALAARVAVLEAPANA